MRKDYPVWHIPSKNIPELYGSLGLSTKRRTRHPWNAIISLLLVPETTPCKKAKPKMWERYTVFPTHLDSFFNEHDPNFWKYYVTK